MINALFVKVLFFAQCRQIVDCDDYILSAEGPLTQAEFWNRLTDTFPGLVAQQKTARLARAETYLQDDELLQPDDEIAIIPPVSGG